MSSSQTVNPDESSASLTDLQTVRISCTVFISGPQGAGVDIFTSVVAVLGDEAFGGDEVMVAEPS